MLKSVLVHHCFGTAQCLLMPRHISWCQGGIAEVHTHTHTHTRWGTVSSFSCTHLLGDLAGAVDELLFGEAVVGAALERPGFGDQACAAVAQLRHLLLN